MDRSLSNMYCFPVENGDVVCIPMPIADAIGEMHKAILDTLNPFYVVNVQAAQTKLMQLIFEAMLPVNKA